MTMMALKILFNVADLPRAGFEGTVRVDRIREEIGQYLIFMALLARKIILAFTKMRDVEMQKSLRTKEIFAIAEIPSPPSR